MGKSAMTMVGSSAELLLLGFPLVFRVQGSGFRVQGSGFRVQGSGFRVQGSEVDCVNFVAPCTCRCLK
jgi:hypothetical protein